MRLCKALRVPGADRPPGGTRGRVGARLLPLAAVAASLAGVGVAQAGPQLQVEVSENGSNWTFISVPTPPSGTVAVPQSFSYADGTAGTVTAFGSPVDNSGRPAFIHMAVALDAPLSARGVAPSNTTLTIGMTETGISAGASSAFFASAIGGVTSLKGTMSYSTYVDLADVAFGKGTLVNGVVSQTIGNQITPQYFGYNSGEKSINLSSPYSMTEFVTLTVPQNTVLSFDAHFADPILVPEPWSLTLLAGALAGLGLLRRRSA